MSVLFADYVENGLLDVDYCVFEASHVSGIPLVNLRCNGCVLLTGVVLD